MCVFQRSVYKTVWCDVTDTYGRRVRHMEMSVYSSYTDGNLEEEADMTICLFVLLELMGV